MFLIGSGVYGANDILLFTGCQTPTQGCSRAVLSDAIHLMKDRHIIVRLILDVDAIDMSVEPRLGVANGQIAVDILEILKVIVHRTDRLSDCIDQ